MWYGLAFCLTFGSPFGECARHGYSLKEAMYRAELYQKATQQLQRIEEREQERLKKLREKDM